MLPASTPAYLSDCLWRDSVLDGKHGCGLASGSSTADIKYVIFGKLRAAVSHTACLTALGYFVPLIAHIRIDKQVTQVSARRVVTAVQDTQPLWDRTVCQNPRKDVRAFGTELSNQRTSCPSVAILIAGMLPFVTGVLSSRRIKPCVEPCHGIGCTVKQTTQRSQRSSLPRLVVMAATESHSEKTPPAVVERTRHGISPTHLASRRQGLVPEQLLVMSVTDAATQNESVATLERTSTLRHGAPPNRCSSGRRSVSAGRRSRLFYGGWV